MKLPRKTTKKLKIINLRPGLYQGSIKNPKSLYSLRQKMFNKFLQRKRTRDPNHSPTCLKDFRSTC